MEKILQSYLRRLTNLSGNNRSLLLLRLISDQFIDIHDLDFANNEPSFKIIQEIIGRKKEIKLCDEIDPRDKTTNKLSQRLRKMARIEEFIFQERGAKDLYIGWPFIKGKFSDGTLVRCPLIFFPVSLMRKNNSWILEQRREVNITFNKTFLLAYAYYNQVSLDDSLIEHTLTDLEQDGTVFRTQLYEILKESQLEINFNQENFMDELRAFDNYKKDAFDQSQKPGELKLFPEAVLGIFPQAGSYLVPDYVRLLESDNMADITDFFGKRFRTNPEEAQQIKFSDQVKEETTFTPFDIDASQEYALNLIKNGNSLVVQGPPGTGKSQLICNLICDYIARGKNVLLVCQKRAALDVVYERLKQQLLHDFVGLVHDFKNDRKSIFEQIARQIDSVDEYRQKNNGLDAIHLERTFLQTSRKIDQLTEELNEFKVALFDESECGRSIKELYLTSDPDQPAFHLNQEYRYFSYDKVPDFLLRLNRFLDYYQKFEHQHHFWILGPSYASFTPGDLLKIREVLHEIPAFQEKLKKESQQFSKIEIEYETAIHFLSHREVIDQLATNLDNDQVYGYYQAMLQHPPQKKPGWLSELERTMLQCFKGPGPETSLQSSELGRFQEALEHAIKARKGLFSWIRWKLFSEDKIFITRVLVANDLKSNKEGFEILLQRIDNRLNFEHIASQINDSKWLIDFPASFRKIDIQNWFFYQKLALKSIEITASIRTLNQYLPTKGKSRTDYIQHLKKLGDFLDQIPVQLSLWSRYLSDSQVRSILLGKEDISFIEGQLKTDFDALVEYHKIKDNFSAEEQKIVSELLDRDHEHKEEVIALFENSLALAWIDHIETKYPSLRSVSSFKLDHLTQELQQAIQEKTAISQEILLLKSRESTYQNLEYNRLNNLVTYKDLYHQVTKKRKVWPIRQVIAQFYEEVFALLPCWLASPESASAMFPMEEMFDLVIFDEASQCFAERGIPAMYRGKQIVVTGDDQQLQPNDLYRVRWEDDDSEEIKELEIDSLLDLAKQHLNEVSLRGHYRSKSLELIEFSNMHFYNGKLKILPDFSQMNKQNAVISYHKVDGEWKNNSNLAEAMKVLEIIVQLAKDNPSKSIGVVTFNISQQSLILDLLDERSETQNLNDAQIRFIKNIENVQGDESEIVIFSTAYAPDEKGKLQLKFGSLNMAGGENRLNVAVTRARESIHMVTSIWPQQMDVSHSTNNGPKLLKAYLQYAKDVSDGKWQANSQKDESHAAEWYLKNQLTRKDGSVNVEKSLPFADLTVSVNNQPKGLILTDDELFYDTLSPKEAHSYKQNHLIKKNWPFVQFFSREYWINRKQAEDKLSKFINRVAN